MGHDTQLALSVSLRKQSGHALEATPRPCIWEAMTITTVLISLQAMLVRYHLPDEMRYTALFYYDESSPPPLPEWFARYNARQTIEAGIKETKSVFTLKRHLVRSPIGMQIQEQFALFGANLVRWAAAWVKDMLRQANRSFTVALDQVKTLVQIASRARARWVRNRARSLLDL